MNISVAQGGLRTLISRNVIALECSEKPVKMPLTDSLPSGPASKVAAASVQRTRENERKAGLAPLREEAAAWCLRASLTERPPPWPSPGLLRQST
jgi:hypothetical protein